MILNVKLPDAPPPGDGFTTVTLAEPPTAMSAAVIAAVNWVELTNVVCLPLPFQFTAEFATKFEPVTASEKAAPPAAVFEGAKPVIVGTELLTVNCCAKEVPPPGVGFVTVTLSTPAVTMSLASIAAESWLELVNVVARGAPFQFTTDVLTNPRPVKESVNAAPPTEAVAGLRLLIPGVGLPAGSTKNGTLFELPPPGAEFDTETESVPAAAISEAAIAAVNCVELTYVVARACPFQFTVETPEAKSVPVTVKENAEPPALALVGLTDVIVGAGLLTGLMKNVVPADDPPPGAGFTTVMSADPGIATRLAGTCAANWLVVVFSVVANGVPFQSTVVVLMRFRATTLSWKAGLPAVM